MSRPKIKQIHKIEDVIVGEEECLYYIQYNEEMTQIMLTIKAGRAMTPEEYMLALASFVEDTSINPESLFVEDAEADALADGMH